MLPNIERGYSFKGVTAYLMDAAADGLPGVDVAGDRVGFVRLLNFTGDEARDPFEAAKLMALTVRDADEIKKAAGIRPGGRKAEAPPVWHTSLSWHPTERPSEAEMMLAVEQCLAAVGLDLDKGHQTYVVQHTDKPHAHVHIVVNLVNQYDGRQRNPHNDQRKAQVWGDKYDRARGNEFCADRAKKVAGREAWIANGKKGSPLEKAFDWAGRGAAVKPAIERLKVETAARYAALRETEQAAFAARRAESSAFWEARKAGRAEIVARYAVRLEGVWNPPPPAPAIHPDRAAFARVAIQLAEREQTFRAREMSFIGRLRNATSLTPPGGGIASLIRLALDADERRRQFERQQRALAAKARPASQPAGRAQPATPSPKSYYSGLLKEARAAELAAYDRATGEKAAALKARHTAAIAEKKAERLAVKQEVAAAWQQLRASYGLKPPVKREFTRAAGDPAHPLPGHAPPSPPGDGPPMPPSDPAGPDSPSGERGGRQEARPDRFGRSRTRKPRDPARRQNRVAAAGTGQDAVSAFDAAVSVPEGTDAATAPDMAQEWHEASGQASGTEIAPGVTQADLDALTERLKKEQREAADRDRANRDKGIEGIER